MNKLEGKIAVVIGATGDIGGQLAISLASMGATVIAAGRNTDKLKRFEAIPGIVTLRLDSSGMDEVLLARDWILGEFKKIDILITSVGTWHMIKVDSKLDDFEIQLCTDLESMVKAAMIPIFVFNQYFREQKSGLVIDFSSHAAETVLPGNLTYSAAKAAVKTFIENLRAENGPDSGVMISRVIPQLVDTPSNRAGFPTIPEEDWKGTVQIGDMASWIADSVVNPSAELEKHFKSKIIL